MNLLNFEIATIKAKEFLKHQLCLNFSKSSYPILLVMSFFIFMSCQKREINEGNLSGGYLIDTVLIDSKGHIIDINGLMSAGLDDRDSIFYMFNMFEHSITEIDLAKNEYINSYPLDKEGPNGVGDFVFGLQLINDSLYFVKSNFLSSLVNKQGQILKRIRWDDVNILDGKPLDPLPRYNEYFHLSEDPKCLALSLDFANQKTFLDVLSINDPMIKRLDVDPLKSYSDFFIRFDDQVNFLAPNVSFRVNDKYVCISHEFSNEIVLYTHEGDFVKVVQYEPQLTSSRAQIPSGAAFKPREEVKKEFQYLLEQVRFESPVYDEKNNRYFRLSAQVIFDDEYEHENSFVPKIKDTRVFISVFDGEFSLISEIEIPEIKNERMKYFAKDGKLWITHNFSDDLGFLVIEL